MFVGRGQFTVVKLTGPHERHRNYFKHYCYYLRQAYARPLDLLVKITTDKIFRTPTFLQEKHIDMHKAKCFVDRYVKNYGNNQGITVSITAKTQPDIKCIIEFQKIKRDKTNVYEH